MTATGVMAGSARQGREDVQSTMLLDYNSS